MASQEIEDKIRFKSRLSKVFEKGPGGDEYLDAVHITVHGSAMLPIKKIPSNPKGIRGFLNIEELFEFDWTVEVRARNEDLNPLLESHLSSRHFRYAKHVVATTIEERWLEAKAKAVGMTLEEYQRQWLFDKLNAEHDGHPITITGPRPWQGVTAPKSDT